MLSEKYCLCYFVAREGNQFSLKIHFSIPCLALGTYSRHCWVCMGRGLGKTRPPRLHSTLYWPLAAPALFGPIWGLPFPGRTHRDHWHLTKVRNSFRETSLSYEYMSLPSTVNPPLETFLVCRYIFLHHFPHSSSEQTHKEPPFSILVTWREAWHELQIHTNLD